MKARFIMANSIVFGMALAVAALLRLAAAQDVPATRPVELELELLVRPTQEKKAAAQKISELKLFDDRLYIGHGDHAMNTGPTDILYYDLQANMVVKAGTVDDHAIMRYCELGGTLVIPGIDATEDWSFGNCYTLEDGRWTKHRNIPRGLHVWDMIEYEGRWYVSTLGLFDFTYGLEADVEPPGTGMIMSSGDKGKTWRFEYANSVDINSFSFIQIMVVFEETLYAFRGAVLTPKTQEYVARNGRQGGPIEDAFSSMETLVYDGVLWRSLDLIKDPGVIGVRPVPVSEKLALLVVFKGKRVLYECDGKTTRALEFKFDNHQDVLVKEDGTYLLVHRDDQWLIAQTSDLRQWAEWILPQGIEPLSIEVDGDVLYVGAKDGGIYRGTLPREQVHSSTPPLAR